MQGRKKSEGNSPLAHSPSTKQSAQDRGQSLDSKSRSTRRKGGLGPFPTPGTSKDHGIGGKRESKHDAEEDRPAKEAQRKKEEGDDRDGEGSLPDHQIQQRIALCNHCGGSTRGHACGDCGDDATNCQCQPIACNDCRRGMEAQNWGSCNRCGREAEDAECNLGKNGHGQHCGCRPPLCGECAKRDPEQDHDKLSLKCGDCGQDTTPYPPLVGARVAHDRCSQDSCQGERCESCFKKSACEACLKRVLPQDWEIGQGRNPYTMQEGKGEGQIQESL